MLAGTRLAKLGGHFDAVQTRYRRMRAEPFKIWSRLSEVCQQSEVRTCTCNWGGILTPKNFVRVCRCGTFGTRGGTYRFTSRSTSESHRFAPTVSLLCKREFTLRTRVDAAINIQSRPSILWIRFNASLTITMLLWQL